MVLFEVLMLPMLCAGVDLVLFRHHLPGHGRVRAGRHGRAKRRVGFLRQLPVRNAALSLSSAALLRACGPLRAAQGQELLPAVGRLWPLHRRVPA